MSKKEENTYRLAKCFTDGFPKKKRSTFDRETILKIKAEAFDMMSMYINPNIVYIYSSSEEAEEARNKNKEDYWKYMAAITAFVDNLIEEEKINE